MRLTSLKSVPYDEAFAAHRPVMGAEGQERLRRATIHTVGAGGAGSNLIMQLAAAGVGNLSSNDHQAVEADNLNSPAFSSGDIGAKKVKVLARRMALHKHSTFRWIALPVEADDVDTYIEAADLVICCANTVSGRLAAEGKAIRYGKPMMQVAVFDGRDYLGGQISVRLPENSWSACAGCCLGPNRDRSSAGSLLSTVTSALAAIAANMAITILSGVRAQVFHENNVFYVDFETYAIEPLAVEKRSGCPVCGKLTEVKP
jgi:hypothetical protein